MERIYRWILIAIVIALVSWGVWYVFSAYNKERVHENGILVKEHTQDKAMLVYVEMNQNFIEERG